LGDKEIIFWLQQRNEKINIATKET
jgi:hypothetical protein